MANKLLIHIGYHKTGTSWLQTHLFPSAELGLGMVGMEEVRKTLIADRPLQFDPVLCRTTLGATIEQIRAKNLYPVISHEELSGNPLSGGYKSKELAQRLLDVFPDAKILITIREQRAIIYSCYQQYIKIGGTSSFSDYVFPRPRWSARLPLFDLENFKYHFLIEHYRNLFGQDNVCVLPYEQFFSAPTEFVGSILDFAGIKLEQNQLQSLRFNQKENVTPNPLALEVKRRLNFLDPLNTVHRPDSNSKTNKFKLDLIENVSSFVGNLGPKTLQNQLKESKKGWLKSTVKDMYADSNRRVATICDIDLKSWGYCLPADASQALAIPAGEEVLA
ncbi:MAG: sulfotransferase [Candidatus Melainabacteria bacterium]|nr:sulfotransferase [Candidatus Melainabacteria bacterium]